MNDKEIKEIAQIINKRCDASLGQVRASKIIGTCEIVTTIDTTLIAEALYKAGYRKVESDDIVCVVHKDNTKRSIKEVLFFFKHNNAVRKQVAEDIYDQLCGHGTTYVKKYIKQHYNLKENIENENDKT